MRMMVDIRYTTNGVERFLNEMNDFDLLSKEGVSYVSACTEALGNNILNELEYDI